MLRCGLKTHRCPTSLQLVLAAPSTGLGNRPFWFLRKGVSLRPWWPAGFVTPTVPLLITVVYRFSSSLIRDNSLLSSRGTPRGSQLCTKNNQALDADDPFRSSQYPTLGPVVANHPGEKTTGVPGGWAARGPRAQS